MLTLFHNYNNAKLQLICKAPMKWNEGLHSFIVKTEKPPIFKGRQPSVGGKKHASSNLGSSSLAQGLSNDGQGKGSSCGGTAARDDVTIDSNKCLCPINTLDRVFQSRIAHSLTTIKDTQRSKYHSGRSTDGSDLASTLVTFAQDLTQFFMRRQIGSTRNATGQYKPLGIAVIVVSKEAVGYNGHAMGTFYLQTGINRNGRHGHTGSTQHVHTRQSLDFLKAISKKHIRLFHLYFDLYYCVS